jgi:hypothetical protein
MKLIIFTQTTGVVQPSKGDDTRFFTLTRSVARGTIQGYGELVRLPGGSATQIIGQIQSVTLRGTLVLLLYCLIAAAVFCHYHRSLERVQLSGPRNTGLHSKSIQQQVTNRSQALPHSSSPRGRECGSSHRADRRIESTSDVLI